MTNATFSKDRYLNVRQLVRRSMETRTNNEGLVAEWIFQFRLGLLFSH